MNCKDSLAGSRKRATDGSHLKRAPGRKDFRGSTSRRGIDKTLAHSRPSAFDSPPTLIAAFTIDDFSHPPRRSQAQRHHDKLEAIARGRSSRVQHLQQGVCSIDPQRQGPEDCARSLPPNGHSMFLKNLQGMPRRRPQKCRRRG